MTERALGLDRREIVLAAVVLVACSTSVGSLLADLYGVASMRSFTLWVTIPGFAILLTTYRRTGSSELRRRIRLGAVAGAAGTIGYDVFRIPFALAGQRIFAPIYSYGLLIDGGSMSSGSTDLLGWLFHFSNGVTFGVAYAVVMARRHWGFGVAWGLFLELAAFLSPFTAVYGLTGKWGSIALAFAAHVAYGLPLGFMVQRIDRVEGALERSLVRPVAVTLSVLVLGLVLWHRPWWVPADLVTARDLAADGPAVLVVGDRFVPEWVAVAPEECVRVVSRSDESFSTPFGDLAADGEATWCFPDRGVHRVPLGSRAYSGGFVSVNPL